MTDIQKGDRCPALFDPYEPNNRLAPARASSITYQCERPAGHQRDRSLGWLRLVHRSARYEWNLHGGRNFRYWACGEVARENGWGRCVKFTAHTYAHAQQQCHETAEGLRWGGLVFIGPDPLSQAEAEDEPERCARVFAGHRCMKASPHSGKNTHQHVVASGDVWIIDHGRGVRQLQARRTRN